MRKPRFAISLHFDASSSQLTVVLTRGKDIKPDADGNQQMHILISAMLMPDGNIDYSCKGIPPNPLFKHNYKFPVKHGDLDSSVLKFNVWSVDKYSMKIPYGECIFNLQDVFKDDVLLSSEDIWLEIQRKDHLVRYVKIDLLSSVIYVAELLFYAAQYSLVVIP